MNSKANYCTKTVYYSLIGLFTDAKCITEDECTEHGWLLVGPACNVYTVTHSIPDVFLLSVILCLATYLVAAFFRDLRHTNYLTYTVRHCRLNEYYDIAYWYLF